MSEFDLAVWLEGLALTVQAEPKDGTIKGYLDVLASWKLTPEQWLELRRRAILRHKFPRVLPMLSELYEIAGELRQEAAIRADEKHLREICQGEREPIPPEVRAQFERLKRHIDV